MVRTLDNTFNLKIRFSEAYTQRSIGICKEIKKKGIFVHFLGGVSKKISPFFRCSGLFTLPCSICIKCFVSVSLSVTFCLSPREQTKEDARHLMKHFIYMAHSKVNSPEHLKNWESFLLDTPSKSHENFQNAAFLLFYIVSS